MKKLLNLIVVVAILTIGSAVYASKNEAGSRGSGQAGQNTTTQEELMEASPTITGNQVQKQNQVETKNMGEDSQLRVETQEEENLGDVQDDRGMPKNESPRNETAKENMSGVAQKVEELLTTEDTQDGIGQQIRQIAQEQKLVQTQIESELGKIDGRKGLLKSILGPDYMALKNVQKQMEQNQLRIQQLEQLQNQLSNEGDMTKVQEAIQALTDQSIALQDRIDLESGSKSLLGWFLKLFAR